MNTIPRDLDPIVVVPARNEMRRLATLLAALAGQHWIAASGTRLPVILVLNNCIDRSREEALAAAHRLTMLDLDLVDVAFPPEHAHVGSARRLGLERALARCADPARTVLLTTDADAVPGPEWIGNNLSAIAAGADLVGGHIVGDAEEEARLGPGFLARAAAIADYAAAGDRLGALIDPLPHDPWPRHRDHTGASLAVRADVYAAAGGLPPLPFREDLAFVSKVRSAGGRVRHPLSVEVRVSARLVGRAAGGMADCLKTWMRDEAEGRPILVEAPERLEARLVRRSTLRGLDGAAAAERRRMAGRLGLDPSDLCDRRGEPIAAAALIERFAPDEPDAPAEVPVAQASARLTRLAERWEAEFHAA